MLMIACGLFGLERDTFSVIYVHAAPPPSPLNSPPLLCVSANQPTLRFTSKNQQTGPLVIIGAFLCFDSVVTGRTAAQAK